MKRRIITYLGVAAFSGVVCFFLGVRFANRPQMDPWSIPHGPDKNLRKLTRLAEGGNPEAQLILGKVYDGMPGFWNLKPDAAQSEFWYLQAAKQWHSKASYALQVENDVYVNGIFSHETRQGFIWGFVSALQGHPHARGWLGIKYMKGDRLAVKDPVLAHAWLTLAHYQGDDLATKRLSELEAGLNDEQRKEAMELAIWLVRNFGRGTPVTGGTGAHCEISVDMSKWDEAPSELRNAEQKEAPTR